MFKIEEAVTLRQIAIIQLVVHFLTGQHWNSVQTVFGWEVKWKETHGKVDIRKESVTLLSQKGLFLQT